MTDRRFKFRVNGEYTGEENNIVQINYEQLTENGWKRYEPENYPAGFILFLHALFNCQNMHFRMKTAERNIQISKFSGTLDAETDEDWLLKRLDIHVDGQLAAGKPTAEDLAFIVDRMKHCPASRNVAFEGNTTISIT